LRYINETTYVDSANLKHSDIKLTTFIKKNEMNKLVLLGAIVIGLTTSCSNSNQVDNADNSINQIAVTNDTNKTIKNKI
jgi:hypothetical protein